MAVDGVNTLEEKSPVHDDSDLDLKLKTEFQTIIQDVIPENPDSFRFLFRDPSLRRGNTKVRLKIGVLAVCMNPIHTTHEEMALKALGDYELDELIVLQLRWSVNKGVFSADYLAQRSVMIYKTFQKNPKISLAILGGGRYFDYQEKLHREFPDSKLYFILGADNFKGFIDDNKGSHRRVHQDTYFLVSPRGVLDETSLRKILCEGDPAFTAPFIDNVIFLPTKFNHNSSSLLRVLIADDEDQLWKRWVPNQIRSLIKKWKMYDTDITPQEREKLYQNEGGFIDLLLENHLLHNREPWVKIQKSTPVRSIKSVYTYYWPEVRKIIDEEFFKFPHQLLTNWLIPDYMESYHKPIMRRFVECQSKFAVPALDNFSNQYPTHGASEAIWKIMTLLKKRRVKNIYVINGEYEGFRVAAEWNDIVVQDVSLDVDPQMLEPSWWFISNPSSRDGNILPNDFVNRICEAGHKVFYDLSFVGTTNPHMFDVSHQNIEVVAFSFSKPYGIFSARVGFAFSREPIESLIGNDFWFKPVFGLAMADAIIRREMSDPLKLVDKYRPLQEKVVARLNSIYDLDLAPSDSILLAHRKTSNELSPQQSNLLDKFSRGDGYRVTLTPFYFEQETFDKLQEMGFVPSVPET